MIGGVAWRVAFIVIATITGSYMLTKLYVWWITPIFIILALLAGWENIRIYLQHEREKRDTES